MSKILVVGAGLSGAVAAWRLRQALGPAVNIECWEYLSDSGGRLGTTSDQGIVADVATQYLSLELERKGVKDLHQILSDAGLLSLVEENVLVDTSERPAGPQWKHFFVPSGTTSVVNFLLKLARASVRTNCCVDWCSVDAKTWKWYVEAGGGKGGGTRRKDSFDAVVLCNGPTHPRCERMDNIWGGWQDVIAESFWKALRQVTWSSCYVITLFLKPECAEQCNRFFGERKDAIQKEVNDDLVQYITYESRKRADLLGKENALVVLVCHTTAEAMWSYKRTDCVQAVQDRVLQTYLKLPRQLAGRVVRRAHSRCWGKCQVTRSISDVSGSEVSHCAGNPIDAPPLALCGDYFLGSTCTDAVVSATDAAEAIARARNNNWQAVETEDAVAGGYTDSNKEQMHKNNAVLSKDSVKIDRSVRKVKRWGQKREA